MKNVISTITLTLIITICISQANSQTIELKKGGYRNVGEFNKTDPFYTCEFVLTKKENERIPELHYITSDNCKLVSFITDRLIWGIYDGTYFYLNAKRMGMISGYIKLDKLEKYSYFIGMPVKSLQQEARIANASRNFGLSGALITNLKVEKENENNIHYVLNIETGMVNLLTRSYMLRILQPYTDLHYNFQKEENNESLGVLLKYLKIMNETEPIKISPPDEITIDME